MFPITVTLHNQAQFDCVSAALKAISKAAAVPKPAAAPGAAPGPATALAQEAAVPETTASASSSAAESAAAQPQVSTAATESADPVTYDQVKPLILKINTTKGRAAATAALAKFGAAKGPELKPEQYAAFVAHAEEVLAA